MHKVSIIVPVHNSSSTLKRCVDSLLNQTHRDTEVILIENGSEDDSLQICEDYGAKDARVKVLSLQTSGVSRARNAGLNRKTGEYFTFVDSDDFIEPDMLEKLVCEAEKTKADMTFCRFKSIKSNGEIFYTQEERIKEVLFGKKFEYLFSGGFSAVIWRVLYKSCAFEGLLFDEDMTFGEDADFLFGALAVSRKNALIDDNLYNYTYLYDNSELTFQKYFKNTDLVIKTYKRRVISTLNLCKKCGLDDFAEAAVYDLFILMVNKVLPHPDYRKKLKPIYKDEFWRGINTGKRYKAHKRYFKGQSGLKAYLIRHKLFALYKLLGRFKRRFK